MIALVTGAAASGKSAFAEELAQRLGKRRVYLATMPVNGDEDARRVARHCEMRAGKGFETFELTGLDSFPEQADVVLLEDLGNFLARIMFEFGSDSLEYDEAERYLHALVARCDNLVIVGNEIGCDCGRYPYDTAFFVRKFGQLSCVAAARSSLVVECVAGVPNVVKGEVAQLWPCSDRFA